MRSKLAIVIADLFLIVGLVLCLFSDKSIAPSDAWRSGHCIVCVGWFAVMIVHTWQHFKLIKAFTESSVRRRNIITTVTLVAMIVLIVSVMALVVSQSDIVVKFHNIVVHGFMVVVILHLVTKSKRLVTMVSKL